MASFNARSVLGDKYFLAVAAAALVVLVIAGAALLRPSGESASREPRYMHCPVCKEELPYDAKAANRKCLSCVEGGKYRPTVKSIRDDSSDDNPGTRVTFFVMLVLLSGLGLAFVFTHRYQNLQRLNDDARQRRLVCQCPFCERKIAFPADRARAGATCSRCKTAFFLPSPDTAFNSEE